MLASGPGYAAWFEALAAAGLSDMTVTEARGCVEIGTLRACCSTPAQAEIRRRAARAAELVSAND